MRRRVLLCLTLISLSACNGDKIGQPISSPVSPPSRSISDGTYALGNPDFFFLPPMVKNPSSSPNWTAGAFNGTLHPVVHICEMTGTTEATATLTTTCSDLATSVSLTDEQYSVNWPVPSSSTVFYRLSVVVGTKVLGWADVETATNASQLKNVTTGEYVPLVDGRTLPVKFRIERYALCDVPGTGPCASSTVDLSSGGTVSTTVVANGLPAGITIPAGAGTTSTTITVQSCPDLPLDSPLFGTCVRITADPALPPSGFAAAATVFICDVNDASVGSRIVDHAQAERITIHRLDPGVEGPVITALPHAPACGEPIASAEGSMRGLLAALRRGSVGAAAHEVLSMLAPKPLYAARFIDLGGGGFTSELSDFQFALPSKMEVVSSTDGQSGAPGSTLALSPTVLVTDLGGTPVRGARIHFSTKTGSVADESVLSDVNGKAGTPWTIATGSVANLLFASGRGIASPGNDGPRDTFDPFQPIQPPFDPGTTNPFPVTVGTGTVTFTATGRSIAIYKNYNAWFGENKDEAVLQSAPFNFVRGTDYFVRSMSELADIPATTTIAIITSPSQGDLLGQVSQERGAVASLEAWVRNGGTLVMHAGYNGTTGYLVPGLSGEVGTSRNCAGLTLAVADHPLIRGPDAQLGTTDDLTNDNIDIASRSCYDNHGNLAGLLPEGAQVLMTEQTTGNPVYATYALGRGRVIVGTLTFEFGPQSLQTLINHFWWSINGSAAPAPVVASRSLLSAPTMPTRSSTETDPTKLYSDGSPKP